MPPKKAAPKKVQKKVTIKDDSESDDDIKIVKKSAISKSHGKAKEESDSEASSSDSESDDSLEENYDEIEDEIEDEVDDETEESEKSESEEEEDDDKGMEEEGVEDAGDDDDCLYKFTGKKSSLDDEDLEMEEDFYFEEDEKLLQNIFVSNDKRITRATLTKYERVRVIGERAKQISLGAKPMMKNVQELDPKEIAQLELHNGVMPIFIIRTLPTGQKERWKVSELKIAN